MASLSVPLNRQVEPLEPGQSIEVRGTPTGDKFNINLQSGSDVGFHLDVRYSEKCFILNNSSGGGEWGKEEKHKMSLKPEQPVDIRIRAQKEDFQIYVNGEEAFRFAFRAPLSQLTTVTVGGEITLSDFQYGKGTYYSMPLEKQLKGLGRGGVVHISGFVDKKCKQFVVNLHDSQGIALHFNPRFNEKAVVRNNERNGTWGEEDREGQFPFKTNNVFDITIHNGDGNFRVEANHETFCIFKHSGDPGSVNKITVEGDIEVHNLQHS